MVGFAFKIAEGNINDDFEQCLLTNGSKMAEGNINDDFKQCSSMTFKQVV